jgi:hypothetical protein
MPRIPIAPGTSIFDFDYTATVGMEEAREGNVLVAYSHEHRAFISVPADGSAMRFALTFPVDSNIADKDIVAAAKQLAQKHSAFIARIDGRQVTLAPMLPAVNAIRARIAEVLSAQKNIQPWDIDVAVEWSAEEPRIEAVTVRTRELNIDALKAEEMWRNVILRLPGGSNGWQIDTDMVTGTVRLTHGSRRALPTMVDGTALLPARAAEAWECAYSRPSIGMDDRGMPMQLDLKAGPHTAIIGASGSGKTVTLRLLVTIAILLGFEVIGIDPTKKFGGLGGLAPYTKGMFTKSVEEAAEVMTLVYNEVQRRVALIEEVGGEDWEDLPHGSVRPWLIVIDEWASLIEEDARPPASLKGTEEYNEWESETIAKGRISSRANKLAREARSAGIHLVLLSQVANANFLPTKIRENLGTSIQLQGKRKVGLSALNMLFRDMDQDALAELTALDDGNKGLAVSVDDGGAARGFRAGFIDKEVLADVLESRGARRPTPLVLGGVGSNSAPSAPARPAAPATAPSWDALDALEPAPASESDFIL